MALGGDTHHLCIFPFLPHRLPIYSRTVNSAPFINPALKTLMNRPGFIPPNQKELTTNVKVKCERLMMTSPFFAWLCCICSV